MKTQGTGNWISWIIFFLYEQITILFLFFHFCIQEKQFWLIDFLYIFYKLSVLFSLSAYSYI